MFPTNSCELKSTVANNLDDDSLDSANKFPQHSELRPPPDPPPLPPTPISIKSTVKIKPTQVWPSKALPEYMKFAFSPPRIVVINNGEEFTSIQSIDLGIYSATDLNFSKYFKAITQIGKNVLRQAFLILYLAIGDSSGATKPIYEYCENDLKLTKTKMNNLFTTKDIIQLKQVPTKKDFNPDITLLHKIITRVLGQIPDILKDGIHTLKNLRNSACHEDIRMNHTELNQRMENLKVLSKEILDELERFTNYSTYMFYSTTYREIDDLLNAQISDDDLKLYLYEINKFKQSKQSKMIADSRKELMTIYNSINILNPCTWLSDKYFQEFAVENTFTPLNIVNTNEIADINDIFEQRNRGSRSMIILSGVMGSGKTSLCRYLLHEWSKNSECVNGLNDFDLLIFIEVRRVTSTSFVQFLREQLIKSTADQFNDSDLIPILQKSNILFVIDGFDEKSVISKLMINEVVSKFPDSRLLFTTRPEFVLEIQCMRDDNIVFQVHGFDDLHLSVYISKFFTAALDDPREQEKEKKNFLNYISGIGKNLNSHLKLPLTIAQLLFLWRQDSSLVTSLSTASVLYENIFILCKQKLVWRLTSESSFHSIDIEKKIDRWLLKLGHIALKMFQQETLIISDKLADELIYEAEKESLKPIETISTFLKCEVTETILGPTYSFSYLHGSAEEFLASRYIAHSILNGHSVNDIFKHESTSRFREIMVFTVGNLVAQTKEINLTVAQEIKSTCLNEISVLPDDLVFWWRLVQESLYDPAICHIVGSLITNSIWTINDTNQLTLNESMLGLLKKTYSSPEKIVINIGYTKSIKDIPHLTEILQLSVFRNNTKLELYSDKQFNDTNYTEVLDSYVIPFVLEDNLISMKGHVGCELSQILHKSCKLESMQIRISNFQPLLNLCVSINTNTTLIKLLRNKCKLKSIELLIDFDDFNVDTSSIVNMKFRKEMTLKFNGITDFTAQAAGQMVSKINSIYESIIFQLSTLSLDGISVFLNECKNTRIKMIRVFTSEPADHIMLTKLMKKNKVRIGWSLYHPNSSAMTYEW